MARILITGSSTGIGRATASELVSRGHEVVATARRLESIADLPVAQRLVLDVTDQESVAAAVAAAGPLDAIVANAGETIRGTVEATPISEFARLMDLNFLGALRVAKAVLPAFRERGAGHIVLVSSILGRLTIPLGGAYIASKFALEAVAETLAIETRDLGISVTTLQPGRVATDGPGKAAIWADGHGGYEALWEAAGKSDFGGAIEASEVAQAIADAIADPHPPLRVPVGAPARRLLTALHLAPTDQPFGIAG